MMTMMTTIKLSEYERDLYEFLWLLLDETHTVDAPAGALQVQTVNEVAERVLTVHEFISRGELRHTREQCGLVQRPTVATTRRLDYGCQVRLGNVQTR